MWIKLAGLILRYRINILIVIALLTAFFAYKGTEVQMAYKYAQMLPQTDSAFIQHSYFKEIFGEEANVFVIGVKDKTIYDVNRFNEYLSFTNNIKEQYGISDVASIGQTINLTKNDSLQKFEYNKLFPAKVNSQVEMDSLILIFKSLPFYEELIYNDTANVFLIAVSLDKELLNTKARVDIIDNVHAIAEDFSNKHQVEFFYSGLPYIRTEISKKIKNELNMFIIMAFFITAIILYIFFHSFKAVFFSLLIVGIGVIWSIGTLSVLGFEITILTGMIPPLLIVIGVPNSIFMLNKYHAEYKKHGNKIKSLQRVISIVGNAIFLTNLTTAAGFATFILTSSEILVEFGIVASLNILGIFVTAITLIPIIFSFLDPPKRRHIKHLDQKWSLHAINKLVTIALNHRKLVYITTVLFLGSAVIGISKMHTTGYMVDDIPKDDPIYTDLKFFESHFNGVMPLEILIDTKEKQGALKLKTIQKLGVLQDSLANYPELSKAYSLAEASKFMRQAYYNGDKRRYRIPVERERVAISKYLKTDDDQKTFVSKFLDSSFQITRMTAQMHDIGTNEMEVVTDKIIKDIQSIFPPDEYYTLVTGTSIIFSKGTEYLIRNLLTSLAIAIVFISLVMNYMFRSWRMIAISLVPNLIPQLMTAALMGYFGIPIKPSTILIFSIAFGISVDDTIHFLAKYRQELKINSWNVQKSVVIALKETGMSMMYTSIILFFGFGIFAASEFGGTKSLGMLVSLTLLFAMFSNLIILPSLLLTFENFITTKTFKEPSIPLFEEEEEENANLVKQKVGRTHLLDKK